LLPVASLQSVLAAFFNPGNTINRPVNQSINQRTRLTSTTTQRDLGISVLLFNTSFLGYLCTYFLICLSAHGDILVHDNRVGLIVVIIVVAVATAAAAASLSLSLSQNIFCTRSVLERLLSLLSPGRSGFSLQVYAHHIALNKTNLSPVHRPCAASGTGPDSDKVSLGFDKLAVATSLRGILFLPDLPPYSLPFSTLTHHCGVSR
jgi:hypothetical protein